MTHLYDSAWLRFHLVHSKGFGEHFVPGVENKLFPKGKGRAQAAFFFFYL
jgi:hypothetical protein